MTGQVKQVSYCDESGQWWIRTKRQRCRAVIAHCSYCQKEFPTLKTRPKPYCSTHCANRANGPSVAKQRTGHLHHNWKGGKSKRGGYVRLRRRNHPLAGASETIAEHRMVMMEHLGRPLHEDETVHHRNGVKDDNRLDNLELWSSNHPAGQRVSDLIRWANEIRERYGTDPGAFEHGEAK